MRKFVLITAAATLAAFGAIPTAHAQSDVDEIVVQGYGPTGPSRLSRAVGFDDLDLTTPEGREVLQLRVRATVGELCRALREDPDATSPIVPSCRDQAMREARPQMRAAIDQAYAQATLAYLDPADIP